MGFFLFVYLRRLSQTNWSNFFANHESGIYAIRGNSKETTGRARGAKQTPEFGVFFASVRRLVFPCFLHLLDHLEISL